MKRKNVIKGLSQEMEHGDAIENLYHEYHYTGPEKIEKFLRENKSSHLCQQSIDNLAEIIDELGEDRVHQLLGLDGEPWITVCTIVNNAEAEERWKQLRMQLEKLWKKGLIAYYSRDVITRSAYIDDCDNILTEAVKQYGNWAMRNKSKLTVEPFFKKMENEGRYAIPDVFLEVRHCLERSHMIPTSDNDPSALQGVFPCADDKRQYEMEDYLKALEEGVDWREYQKVRSLSTPDYGAHGSIKGHILQNPGKTIGDEWKPIADEQQVGPIMSGDSGRIDLVFKSETDEKYLLVEVKPDKDGVDSAFGQVGRYKYQFLANMSLPHLSTTDIKLAIAAPDFYDSHQRIAKEWGIKLVQIN